MIKDIDDLENYQLRLFNRLKNKDSNTELLIKKFNICKKDIYKFKVHKINLPSSYLNVVENLDINGKIIDYFSISPSAKLQDNFVDKIIKNYEDPFFPKEFMNKHNMYQIGSYNTDLVCITNETDQYQEGEILFVLEGHDIYNPQDDQIKRLAKDYEQFLILAGNLNQVGMEIKEDDSNYEEKRQEFLERLKILNVDPKYHDTWDYLF